MTSATAFPDSSNYLTNVYMLVWKYVQADGKAYYRMYSNSTTYTEKSRTAALPATGNYLNWAMTAVGAEIGHVLNLYYTRNLSDAELTAIYNGVYAASDLAALHSFTFKESSLVHCFEPINNGTFRFVDASGIPTAKPYYDVRINSIHAAYPLLYGFTLRSMQQVPYLINGSKGMVLQAGDVEYPSSSCIHNYADSRLYFDGITDADVKTIFDKSNRTYWKASIESEDDYLDAGGGYYGVWRAEQLQRDFIETHAEAGHENHIFASLRTSGSSVTGLTAIRVYKTNLT